MGIRTHLRAMERAAYFTAWQEKKMRGLILVISAAFRQHRHAPRAVRDEEGDLRCGRGLLGRPASACYERHVKLAGCCRPRRAVRSE